MNLNPDTQRLWFSRASFGLSVVALAAVVYGGCQDRSTGQLSPAPDSEHVGVGEKPGAQPGTYAANVATHPEAKPSAALEPTTEEAPRVDEVNVDSAKDAPKPALAVQDSLTVKRLVVTTEVKDREPLTEAPLSLGGGPIMAFVEVANTAETDQKIIVTFEHDGGKKVGFVELSVPGKQARWRTWGQTQNIKQGGEWTAVVSTQDGVELSRQTFSVGPA